MHSMQKKKCRSIQNDDYINDICPKSDLCNETMMLIQTGVSSFYI